MSFLMVDKDRLKRRGSVYIALINGIKVVVGRASGDSRVGAMLKVAGDFATKSSIPSVSLLKFKKSTDTYKDEAFLNSMLYEWASDEGDWYYASTVDINKIWREV